MSDTPHHHHHDDPAGIFYAGFAYSLWGVLPLYWRLMGDVPPLELTAHRIVWCALFVIVLIAARGTFPRLLAIFANRRLVATLALTGILISINWTIFLYGVVSHQLVEASLGYYINPLISIGLGIVFFGEKMSRFRIAAIVLAATAVAVRTVDLGHFPWIALSLALSFGFYGYFRKTTHVNSIDGLAIETWILFPVAAGLVLWLAWTGKGAFPSAHAPTDLLLISTGPITALPLSMFAAGARRIRLSTLGFLQYLSPSLTLVLAVFNFGERFSTIDAITFACVWAALAIIAVEGQVSRVRRRRLPQAPA